MAKIKTRDEAPVFTINPTFVMSLIAAAAMIVTALLTKNTEYENAFLYIFMVWAVLFAIFEFHARKVK